MGACSFIEFEVGQTVNEAFERLVEQARWEYGHDPYNGTISTTHLVRGAVKQVAEVFTEEAMGLARDYAKSQDFGKKWESRTIDCGKADGGTMWAFYGWAAC